MWLLDYVLMPMIVFLLVVLVAMLVAIIVIGVRQELLNRKAPVITSKAKVVRVKNESKQMYLPNVAAKGALMPIYSDSYYIAFELVDEEQMCFSVNENIHDWLDKGDTGILTYQGTWFLGFELD